MGPTLTSSPSSRSSTFSNSSTIDTLGQSTSPTSASSNQSSERLSSSGNQLSTCDSTSTGGRPHTERDNSSQVAIKRFIFGDYNIDWKAIPALDLDEDASFSRVTLLRRRDLRCKASREYYMEVLNGFRLVTTTERSTSSPDINTIVVDGEEVVDMIG